MTEFGINKVVAPIVDGLNDRGLNSTGKLAAGTEFTVSASQEGIRGTGYAPYYWKWGGGSGRGPGKPPPVDKLKAWVAAQGMPEGAAYAIAKKIGREGSKDYREGNPNVFIQVVDKAADQQEALHNALNKDFAEPIFRENEQFE